MMKLLAVEYSVDDKHVRITRTDNAYVVRVNASFGRRARTRNFPIKKAYPENGVDILTHLGQEWIGDEPVDALMNVLNELEPDEMT